MELKRNSKRLSISTCNRSNRTFMELKQIRYYEPWNEQVVLIVPLWN